MNMVNITLFYTNNGKPIVLDLARLDGSGGIGENEAQYNQSLMFNHNENYAH